MSDALRHLLRRTFKEELGDRVKLYECYEAIFPKHFMGRTESAKSTLASRMPTEFPELLELFAGEWRNDEDKQEFVTIVEYIVNCMRRNGFHEQGCDLARKLAQSENAEIELPCFRPTDPVLTIDVGKAREQFVSAIMTTVRRTWIPLTEDTGIRSVIGRALRDHCDDAIVGGGYNTLWGGTTCRHTSTHATGDYYGLQYLFSAKFRDDYDMCLRRDFVWKTEDPSCLTRYWLDCERLEARYMSDKFEERLHLEVVQTVFAIHLIAALIGPGPYARYLGWDLVADETRPSSSLTYEPYALEPISWRLQPVVLTGEGWLDYFTDNDFADGRSHCVEFAETDVVRMGRDEGWLNAAKHLLFHSPRVSRKHAILSFEESGWTLTDQNSANGTLVLRRNGAKVFIRRPDDDLDRSVHVNAGDVVVLGPQRTLEEAEEESVEVARPTLYERGVAYRLERIVS